MADSQRDLLNFFYKSFSGDIGLLSGKNLANTELSAADPRIIHDLTGAPLFADFEITDNTGQSIGVVRSSARGKDLPLIDSILIGLQWFDPVTAVERAKAAVAALHAGPILDVKVVCYGYPRMGVLVTCQAQADSHSFVFDAATGVLVNQFDGVFSPPGEAGPGGGVAEEVEGEPFYSILSEIPEAGPGESPALIQWNEIQNVLSLSKKTDLLIAPAAHMAEYKSDTPDTNAHLNALPKDLNPDSVRFAVRGSLLPSLLESQATPVFCAVATAEMMLSFVGVTKTQDEIAATMKTGQTGTTNPNFIAGIKLLSASKMKATFTPAPAFTEFVNAVEAMLPAKSGIPGHARLLRGWREYVFFDALGTVIAKQQFLIINDPYPVDSGQLVLENFTKPIPDFYANIITMRAQL